MEMRGVVGTIMTPKEATFQVPEPVSVPLYMPKGNTGCSSAGVQLETLSWITRVDPRQFQASLKIMGGGRRERESLTNDSMRTQPNVLAHFEDEGRDHEPRKADDPRKLDKLRRQILT